MLTHPDWKLKHLTTRTLKSGFHFNRSFKAPPGALKPINCLLSGERRARSPEARNRALMHMGLRVWVFVGYLKKTIYVARVFYWLSVCWSWNGVPIPQLQMVRMAILARVCWTLPVELDSSFFLRLYWAMLLGSTCKMPEWIGLMLRTHGAGTAIHFALPGADIINES